MAAVQTVAVYRSERRADTYLLVAADEALARVPEALQQRLAPMVRSFEFELDDQRKLVRVDTRTLRQALDEQGFYLQLPPPLKP